MSVYLRAASIIALASNSAGSDKTGCECFCCPALHSVGASQNEKAAFRELFGLTLIQSRWWGRCACGDGEPDNQQARLLGLLFMHWISEDARTGAMP